MGQGPTHCYGAAVRSTSRGGGAGLRHAARHHQPAALLTDLRARVHATRVACPEPSSVAPEDLADIRVSRVIRGAQVERRPATLIVPADSVDLETHIGGVAHGADVLAARGHVPAVLDGLKRCRTATHRSRVACGRDGKTRARSDRSDCETCNDETGDA